MLCSTNRHLIATFCLSSAVGVVACHDEDTGHGTMSDTATGGTAAPTAGTVAPTRGTVAPTAGTVAPVGGTAAPAAGTVATMSPNEAGKAAGTGGSATRNAGEGGMTGSAGATNTGGVAGTAGSPRAGADSAGGSSGGHAPSTGHCEPIGWATRAGRTGGEVKLTGGGDATPVVVSSFDKLQSLAQDAAPRVIHIDGNAGGVGSGWKGTSGDRLEVGSNKTIIGLHPGTQLKAAIHVKDASNVIIRNLVIRGPGSNSDQAWDNLNIEGSSKNIWIDHCEFWDGQDGNADVVKGADNVTFTWNIFGYRTNGGHNFSNLVASSDDESVSEGKLNITLMFNWFTGVAQRQPRCRYGDIHVVNNLFSKDGLTSDYGISAGKDCKIVTEANHFIEINSPIYMSHASGSAGNELRGDNLFEKTSGSMTGYGTAFDPPYKYQHVLVKAAEVKAKLDKRVGATLQSPNECDW